MTDHAVPSLADLDVEPVDGSGTKKEVTSVPLPATQPEMWRGVLGQIVTAADPSTEADPVGVLVSLLAGVGVIIGPTPHVQVGNTRHPLLVWPLLFGRTGSGRKGEAGETAGVFLRSACQDYEQMTVSGLSSGEGLIERLKDPEPEPENGSRRKSQGSPGTTDKRLIVIEPEFSSVMARAKREGSTLPSVLRQAWDGRALHVLNRAALSASASHVAVIGHITPKEFRLRLAETEMAGGTYNRFLPIYVEKSKRLPIPDGIDHATINEMGKWLREDIANARQVSRVQLSADAAKLWTKDLYDELTESDDDDAAWTEFARRAAPYCLRIAGLYSVLEGNRLIDRDDLVAAAALVRYAIASARFVLARQARNPRLDRIRRAIDSSQDGLTRTEISRLFSNNLTKEALALLLSELISDEENYEVGTVATGGRPAERYRRRTLVTSFFVPHAVNT